MQIITFIFLLAFLKFLQLFDIRLLYFLYLLLYLAQYLCPIRHWRYILFILVLYCLQEWCLLAEPYQVSFATDQVLLLLRYPYDMLGCYLRRCQWWSLCTSIATWCWMGLAGCLYRLLSCPTISLCPCKISTPSMHCSRISQCGYAMILWASSDGSAHSHWGMLKLSNIF